MHRMRKRLRRTGPRTTKQPPRPVARGPVPRKAPQPPLRHIKVLSDLRPVLFLMSIDIKVFQTFAPRARAAHPAHPAHPDSDS